MYLIYRVRRCNEINVCVYHYGFVKLLLHPRIIERAAEHIVCGMTGIVLGQRKTNTMHSVDERKKNTNVFVYAALNLTKV